MRPYNHAACSLSPPISRGPGAGATGCVRDVLEVLIIAVVLYIAIWSALQTVRVDGESMVGTLQNNDLLLASKISYYFGDPQRGDIVVLIPPSDPTKDFIKRVIGIPGDTIEIDGSKSPTAVLIKPQGKGPWQRLQEPYLPGEVGHDELLLPSRRHGVLGAAATQHPRRASTS